MDFAHVELYDGFAVVGDERADEVDAVLVRGDLRFQVVEVVGETAGAAAPWVLSRVVVEEFGDEGLVEVAFRDELFGLDGRALLVQLAGMGRHRAGKDAADVGVMSAGGDVEDYVVAVEGGDYDCYVGKMGPAEFGVIGDDDITGLELALPDLGLGGDTGGHAAEVDG